MADQIRNRVLITGGAGAIGNNLANTLAVLGDDVTVLDDLSSGHASLLSPLVRFIKGSVCVDADLEKAFENHPQEVFHLAALFANQNSVDNPRDDIAVNGLGTIKVLEFSTRHAVRKFLYASSSCVYGNIESMEEDNAMGCVDTPYAITKFLGEKYCKFWSEHHGLDTVIVRLFNSYGPGEFAGRYRNVIPNFFSLAMNSKPLTITGSGYEIRDFNYVDDTVKGMIKAMSFNTSSSSVYNLASGKGTKIIDLAYMINDITGSCAGVVLQPRRTWDSVQRRIGNIDKSKHEFGYAPETGLYIGLCNTYEWLRSFA